MFPGLTTSPLALRTLCSKRLSRLRPISSWIATHFFRASSTRNNSCYSFNSCWNIGHPLLPSFDVNLQ